MAYICFLMCYPFIRQQPCEVGRVFFKVSNLKFRLGDLPKMKSVMEHLYHLSAYLLLFPLLYAALLT